MQISDVVAMPRAGKLQPTLAPVPLINMTKFGASLDLRPYQATAIEAAETFLLARERSGLLVLPTGAGKSLLLATLARNVIAQGGRALVLAHVAELIVQNALACVRVVGTEAVGIFAASAGERNASRPITIASIQTAWRQAQRLGPQDLVFVDEAHLINPTAGAGMYRRLLDDLEALGGPTPLIGLTATPWRLTSGRLDRPWRGNPPIFERVIHEVGIRDLICDGYLCRPISKATRTQIEATGVSVRHGEYSAGELQAAADVEAINRAIVAEIIEAGRGRRAWIVFATGVQHARNLATLLCEAGISAAAIEGEMPTAQRDAAISAFKRGELRALVSMNVLTTGFDAPAVDLIALCRPTLSPGLHVQMIGRGTRLSPATRKTDCLVLDFAGNCLRHGPLDLINGAELGRSRGNGEAPAKACPDCSTIVATATRTCPECGHQFHFEPKEAKLSTAGKAAPILSDDPVAANGERWVEVRSARASCHWQAGKPPSLRLEYLTDEFGKVSEFLAFESANPTAQQIARSKWKKRTGCEPPATAEDALARIKAGELRSARWILVRPSSVNSRFSNVVKVADECPGARVRRRKRALTRGRLPDHAPIAHS